MFFFFKQKTAYEMRISDWSSDVCSSDLAALASARARPKARPAMALTAGFKASIRAIQASSSSTGEIAFVPMRRRSSTAERAVRDIVSSMWTGAACLVDQPFRLRVRVERPDRAADLGVGQLGLVARQRRVRLHVDHLLGHQPEDRPKVDRKDGA